MLHCFQSESPTRQYPAINISGFVENTVLRQLSWATNVILFAFYLARSLKDLQSVDEAKLNLFAKAL